MLLILIRPETAQTQFVDPSFLSLLYHSPLTQAQTFPKDVSQDQAQDEN